MYVCMYEQRNALNSSLFKVSQTLWLSKFMTRWQWGKQCSRTHKPGTTKEGLGPKPLRHKLNSGSITSDGTSVEKHRDLTRLHLLSETAKWWPDTKYLLSKLKAKKKIKMLFSCTVCWSWVRKNHTGVDCCMNGLTTVQQHSNLSHQVLSTKDKINVLLFSPFYRVFFFIQSQTKNPFHKKKNQQNN